MSPWAGLRRLARHRVAVDAFGYTGGIILSRIPPFLFLPIYASRLEPAILGRYVTAMILIDLIQTLSGVGMVQALGRFFPGAPTPDQRRRMLGTALAAGMSGCAAVGAAVGLAYAVPTLRGSLEILRALDPDMLLLALAAGGLITLNSILIVYLRAEQRAKAFLAVMSLSAALEAGLSLAMVAADRVDLTLILAIECARGAVTAVFLLLAARRDLSLRFSPDILRSLLGYGLWLFPVGFFVWVMLSIDRFWLGQMAGMESVGVYGFFYKFAAPMAILFQGYMISMDSHLFKASPEAGHALVERSLARYLSLGGLLVVATAGAFSAAIFLAIRHFRALPEIYLTGLKVYPLLLATTFVYYWAIHYASLLEFQFRPRRQLGYMALAAAANAALCPALIWLGARIGLDAISAAALANLMAAAILLGVQSADSGLRSPGRPFWWKAVPALLLLAGMFALLRRAV